MLTEEAVAWLFFDSWAEFNPGSILLVPRLFSESICSSKRLEPFLEVKLLLPVFVILAFHSKEVGTWRSLVAHLNGVQGVASSNLAVPTNNFPRISDFR